MSGTYGSPEFDDVNINGLGSVKTILGGLADVVSTAANQVLQIAQETATAAALGTTADAQWSGTGNASVVAALKAIYVATVTGTAGDASAANQATQITAANLTNTNLAGIETTLSGTLNVSDATSHTSLSSILAQDTATATATGTTADAQWSGTGNSTAIAALKAIFTKLNSSTLLVSDATSHTTLTAIQTALGGTLLTSDATSHTSLASILTAVTGTLATSDATSHTTLTAIQTALGGTLATSDATTHTQLTSLLTAVGVQGVAAGTGLLSLGGVYNTTLPTLTTGMSSRLQLDASGRVILANGTGGIVTVSSGTSANTLAQPIHVDISQGAAALSAANGLFTNIVQAGAVVATGNPLFIQDTVARTSLASILTQDTATAAATGTIADAAWTTGSGTIISLLKAIASATPTGAATSANQVLQIAQETLSAAALGTPADTTWSGTGSGTTVAILKKIATGGSIVTETNLDNTYAAGIATAPAGQLIVGGIYNVSPVTLTTGQVSQLQLNANGYLRVNDVSLDNAIALQAAVPSVTNHLQIGGIFNTTAPTLTTGQASKLQVDVNGSMYVNIRAQAGATLNVSDATTHTSLATIASTVVAKASAGAPAFLVGIGIEALSAPASFTTGTTNSPIADLGGRLYVTDDQSHTTLTSMLAQETASAASLVSILTQDTATAAALGTTADTTWSGTGAGSAIAILKKIATGSTGAVTTGADAVSGAVAGTGMFQVGGVATTAAPSLTTGNSAPLSLTTSGALRVSDPLMETSATTQAATPGTGMLLFGGIFNTTPPTLTSGQAGRLQLDATGGLILGAGTKAIGSVILGAGAAAIGSVTLGAGAAAIGSVSVSSSALPALAATSTIQATQQTSLTAIAAAAGTTADTAWTTGAGTIVALLKAIATISIGTSLTSDAITHTALGAPTDTAWVSGSGSAIAILKTIAGASGGGGGTVNQGTAGASPWLVADTVSEAALGTPADTAWTTGSGSLVAISKAVSGLLTSINSALAGTLTVSDATSHTTLATIASALAGTLAVSDNTSHTSLSSILTADNASAAALGSVTDTAWVSGSGSVVAVLKKIAGGGGGGAVTTGADNTQGAAAGTGLFSVGGVFLTTPPTLTNGQAGHLQLTANGYVMTADQGVAPSLTTQGGTPGTGMQLSGGIFNTTPPTLTTGQAGRLQLDSTGGLTLGTSAKTIGTVNLALAGTAISAAAPLTTKEFKGAGAMTATPAGSTNGTALGTMITGGNGARIYLKPADSLTFTIAATAPSSAPTAVMTITGNLTGPNWDEPLAAGQMIYITVKVGTPMFRFL